MRLYLSSFMTGDCPQRLVSLAGAGTRAAVVLNALDNFPRQRAEWLGTQRQTLESLGFVAHELDLRAYFGDVDRLAAALDAFRLLWIKRRGRKNRDRGFAG